MDQFSYFSSLPPTKEYQTNEEQRNNDAHCNKACACPTTVGGHHVMDLCCLFVACDFCCMRFYPIIWIIKRNFSICITARTVGKLFQTLNETYLNLGKHPVSEAVNDFNNWQHFEDIKECIIKDRTSKCIFKCPICKHYFFFHLYK